MAVTDNPSTATTATTHVHPSVTTTTQTESSYTQQEAGMDIEESSTDNTMKGNVSSKNIDSMDRTSTPSIDSNGAGVSRVDNDSVNVDVIVEDDGEKEEKENGDGDGEHEHHVQLARQVTETGEIVPNSYLDYISKLRALWDDVPDVIVDMKDLSYTLSLPNSDKYV